MKKFIIALLMILVSSGAYALDEVKSGKGLFSTSVETPTTFSDTLSDQTSSLNSRIEHGGASQYINFSVNNSNKLRITDTGIGIGTDAPTNSLDVEGGEFFLPVPSGEPLDGDMANSQITFWLDEGNNEIEAKARESGGSFISVTLGSGGGGGSGNGKSSLNFNLTGPFNTTFERIDGFRQMDDGKTFVTARLTMFNSGSSGQTSVIIRRGGPSGAASTLASIAATNGTSTQATTLSPTMQVVAGDYIWVDVSEVPAGTAEDLSVDIFQ